MEIVDKFNCTGCSLCAIECPTKAIQLKYLIDPVFLYPVVDSIKCINCKKCIDICPVNNRIELLKQQKIFIGQNLNCETLKTVTSGGIATAVSKQFIKNGGIVYGAAFNDKMQIEHIRCIDEKELNLIKGSKYIESDISRVYTSVLEDLKYKNLVLFIGTPCQCAAMRKKFNKYTNFYCCDFICNGVGSPKIFKNHINNLEKIYKCKIKNYIFRPKVKNYLEPYECFIDSSNYMYRIKSPWKKWGSIYYSGLVMRLSCYNCMYSSELRIGDITFSDISSDLMKKMEYKLPKSILRYGASCISINTEKGKELLKLIKNEVFLEEIKEKLKDSNKHIFHNIEKRNKFCKIADISLIDAKIKYFGRKLRIKSWVIDLIEFIKNRREIYEKFKK